LEAASAASGACNVGRLIDKSEASIALQKNIFGHTCKRFYVIIGFC
jgi:hypothetical protein